MASNPIFFVRWFYGVQKYIQKETTRWTIIRGFFVALGAFLISILDPVGLTSATDQQSISAYNRITSPFYNNEKSGGISILLIDENTINAAKANNHEIGYLNYPPTLRQYADILYNVAKLRPKAIFVDMLLLDPRGDTQEQVHLENTLKRIKRAGVDVYFPNPNLHTRTRSGQGCTSLSLKNIGNIDQISTASPFVRFQGYDRYYPLVGYQACNNEIRYSPALRLYYDQCQKEGNCTSSIVESASQVFSDPMDIQWGNGLAQLNIKYPFYNQDCQEQQADFKGKLARSIRYLAEAILNKFLSVSSQKGCFFHSLIPMLDFLKFQKSSDLTKKKIAGEFVANKVVMIGASLIGNEDLTQSPTIAQVPGVVAHAMAYDNLRTYGTEYYRPAEKLFWHIDATTLVEFCLTIFIIIVEALIIKSIVSNTKQSPYKLVLKMAFLSLLVFLTIFSAEITFVSWWNFEPVNWLGVSMLALTFIGVLTANALKGVFSSRLNESGQAKVEDRHAFLPNKMRLKMKKILLIGLFLLSVSFLGGHSSFAADVQLVNVIAYDSIDNTVDLYSDPMSGQFVTVKTSELLPLPFEVVRHPQKPHMLQYSDKFWLPESFVQTDEKTIVVTDMNCLIKQLKERPKLAVARSSDYGQLVSRGLGNCKD